MSNFVEKKSIFEGMTMSQMKEAYSKMSAKERGQFAGAFVRAAKTAKKPAARKSTKDTPSTQQAKKPAPKKTKVTKTKEAQALERRRSRMTPEARALDTKRARRVLDRPATGAMANKVDSNNAKKALSKKTGRSGMSYAGKFPGEPDKEEKKKKPRNLGKGSFRNFYK